MRSFIIALICLFLAFGPASAVEKEATLHQPNYEVWVPPTFLSSEDKWPLIIFSHGFGGCGKQSSFLMQYLADNGYIVAAPDHADARWCRNENAENFERTEKWPEQPFRYPEKWTDQTDRDRHNDILFVLEDLLKDRKYTNYIDQEKIGLMGHSLGGYTVLGLAGAWPSWKDERFKAIVALSPFVQPYVMKQTLDGIDVPVMYQGGTKDKDITPVIKKSMGAYAITQAPKYFIELQNADHFAWTQLDKDHRDIINQTVLAFFDRYLRSQDDGILEGDKIAGAATYWKEVGAKQQKTPPSVDE